MLDALAKLILQNPEEALGIVSALVALIVAALSQWKWLGVPEAKLRRWLTTVVVAVVTGCATEWLSPPWSTGKAFANVLATLGGATVLFRAAKWLLVQIKPKE